MPVILVLMFTYLYSFEERGPQSQGLPALMVIFAAILGVLGVNTLIATLLSVFVPDVRPGKKSYFFTLLVLAVLGELLYLGLTLS